MDPLSAAVASASLALNAQRIRLEDPVAAPDWRGFGWLARMLFGARADSSRADRADCVEAAARG